MNRAERNEQIYHQFLELINEGETYTKALEKLSSVPYGEGYQKAYLSVGTLKKIIHDKREEAKNGHKKTS